MNSSICTKDRECLFGGIVAGEMIVNGPGEMVLKAWNDLPVKYSNMDIDEFIVMPNHVHGIIVLPVGAGPRACPDKRRFNMEGQPQGVAPTRLSLPDIVHR